VLEHALTHPKDIPFKKARIHIVKETQAHILLTAHPDTPNTFDTITGVNVAEAFSWM
jgi:hypothetical protein